MVKGRSIEQQTDASPQKSSSEVGLLPSVDQRLNLYIREADKECFEERAAIHEFDGAQDRLQAEKNAIKDIEAQRFKDLNKEEQESLLDVFRTLLKWSKDLEGGTK